MDGTVLDVMSEGHLSLVVVSVPEVVETGRDVISMLLELQLNVQEAKKKLNLSILDFNQ